MLLIQSMRGLGDNIYQRAFVKQLRGPVCIDTPWPELYRDLPNVQFVRPVTKLRTQAKNVERQQRWDHQRFPFTGLRRPIGYGDRGILTGMRESFRTAPGVMDLPDFGSSPVSGRYVVVRPVTVRSEWRADSRNPLPEYIHQAALAAARVYGLKVVSVADLSPDAEWLVGDAPYADIRFHGGELDVTQLLALLQGAQAVIGGIGWIVPACHAANVPAWIVCGGQGGYNAPELICPSESAVSFAVPDNFCRCKHKQHDCDKRITNYGQHFAAWAARHLALE